MFRFVCDHPIRYIKCNLIYFGYDEALNVQLKKGASVQFVTVFETSEISADALIAQNVSHHNCRKLTQLAIFKSP